MDVGSSTGARPSSVTLSNRWEPRDGGRSRSVIDCREKVGSRLPLELADDGGVSTSWMVVVVVKGRECSPSTSVAFLWILPVAVQLSCPVRPTTSEA